MKKFLVGLLAITASVCCALGISACGSNDKDKEKADEWGTVFTVQSAYAKATELGYTGTLEEFIASISGTDGTNGEDGEDGVGISSVTINKDGQLVIVLSDKTELNLGKVVGEDGEDGLGISKVEINDNGEIVITFTDETTKNLGKIPDCDHSYSSWTVGLEPTCTSVGYSTRTCQKCGYTDYKFAEKTGHTWDEGVVIKNSTSTEKGLKIYSCTTCRTAKTEELELLQILTEAEWKAAVQKTIMSDNFSYEMTMSDSSGNEQTESVIINLDKGLSYFFQEGTIEGDSKIIERYYQINETDKVYFTKDNDSLHWQGTATTSDYLLDEYKDAPEMVKYELNNTGYSFLESLKNVLTYDGMWGCNKPLADAYASFVYDAENDAYSIADEDGIYSFKFDGGYISEIRYSVKNNGFEGEQVAVFNYGNATVTIPREVTDDVSEQGLVYSYSNSLKQTHLTIKPQYFGITVKSIGEVRDGNNILIAVTIPESVTIIGEDAFSNNYSLKDIHFGGSKEQWNAITKGKNWDYHVGIDVPNNAQTGGYTVHCSNGEITVEKTADEVPDKD